MTATINNDDNKATESLAEQLAKFDMSEEDDEERGQEAVQQLSTHAFVGDDDTRENETLKAAPNDELASTTATATVTTATTTTTTITTVAATTTTSPIILTTNGTTETVDELMIKKKETVMLMSLKRRAELEVKRAMKEKELAYQREQAAMKREMLEQRKLEHRQRREVILEQYRQKKKAAEAAERDGQPTGEKSSSSACNASQMNLHQKNSRTLKPSQSSHHVSVWTLYNGPKLFAKPTTKTNLITIQNAILKALEGAANAKTLKKMQDTINAHSKTCGHFLILFRSRHQFRGLYEYDEKQNTITKLDGVGPKTIRHEDILKYYKFDSPKRQFTEVQTRQISLTIIAFTIQDHLWSKTLSSRVSAHDLCHQQKNGH